MQWRLSKNGAFTVWSFYGGIKRLCSLRFSLEGSLEGQSSYEHFSFCMDGNIFFFWGGGGEVLIMENSYQDMHSAGLFFFFDQ